MVSLLSLCRWLRVHSIGCVEGSGGSGRYRNFSVGLSNVRSYINAGEERVLFKVAPQVPCDRLIRTATGGMEASEG